MEFNNIIKSVAENSMGLASFAALLIYIFKYQSKANDTLEEISKTLVVLNERVDKLEKKEK